MANKAKYKKGMVGIFTPPDQQAEIFGAAPLRQTNESTPLVPEEAEIEIEEQLEDEAIEAFHETLDNPDIEFEDAPEIEIEGEEPPEIEIEDGGELCQVQAYMDEGEQIPDVKPQILAWLADGMTIEDIQQLCTEYIAENKDGAEPEQVGAVKRCVLIQYLLNIHPKEYWGDYGKQKGEQNDN